MKIKIENNNVSVIVKANHDYCNKEQLLDICNKMHDTILSATERSDMPIANIDHDGDIHIALLGNQSTVPTTTPPEKDTMVIRPRIPNNVVDINDLTIEKAVTENALVRCPKCGQAHCLAVPSNSHIYLMRRDFKDNEFGIIAEFESTQSQDFLNACCKPETDKQAYYNDLQNFDFAYESDFTVENNTEIFCPVCCVSSTFNLWKDAFENPLDFFETEHLCDACGGEKLEKLIKKHKIYKCDKCGLETNFKEE